MSEQIDTFRSQLRTKVDEAGKRLKDLEAKVKATGEKAKSDAKAHLASLETMNKAQQAKVQAAEAKVKAWAEERRTITSEKVSAWKAQRQVKELSWRADNAERYAAATIEIAAAAIDEAENAIVEAIVARLDADAAQSDQVKKSA
jgi:L-amino acid N-acyltransferase YncA